MPYYTIIKFRCKLGNMVIVNPYSPYCIQNKPCRLGNSHQAIFIPNKNCCLFNQNWLAAPFSLAALILT